VLHPAGSRVVAGDNPFDVAPELDYFQGPRTDVPLWNETWFFSSWSPGSGVGVFIHAGADATDPELFYAQVIAYLPDGGLVAERVWGRPTPGDMVVGGFSITTEEPLRRWRVRFDGAGERTTSDQAGRRPVGAGLAVPMSFDIEVSAAGPIWDLFKASDIPHSDWAGIHHEQNTYSRGVLTVGGTSWHVDGVGFRDHSTGPRDFSRTGGDRFWGFVSPATGRGFQGIKVWNREGELELSAAAYHADGALEVVNGAVELTGIEDTLGNPKDLELSFVRPGGAEIVAQGRILHTVTITIDDPNHNINGTLLEGDPLILSESQVRFDWPDGDVFYGHLERVARLADLRRP
jgi:hypothetical protein